jgi:AraC-like DNA-binding protein
MSVLEDSLMPATCVRLMAQASRDPERLVRGSGLALRDVLERDEPITVGQQLICARNSVAMTARSDWHFAWAETIGEHFHGPLTAALFSAPTLGDGLDIFLRYMPSRILYLAWRGRRVAGSYRVELKPLLDLGELASVLVEIPLLALLGCLRTVRGGRIAGAAVEFAHAPAVAPPRYEQRFRCEFRFAQRAHALVVPATWLQLPNVGYDPLLWRTARSRCEQDLRRGDGVAVVGQLRQYLMRSFDVACGGRIPPTVGEAATEMHMSVCTLHRRLQAAGLTCQGLVDDARRERAAELLLDLRVKVGCVAAVLGYRDPANFSRAY